MFYIVLALLLFAVSVMIHIFFCRTTYKPGLHARAFIFIATISLCVYAAGAYAAGRGNLLGPDSLWGLPFKVTAGAIFVLLVPVYLSFYILTQLMSPSKKILQTVSLRGKLSHDDIVLCVEKEDFIDTRLKDLYISGCIKKTENGYVLGPAGKKLAAVLNVMQRVLGRDIGG